MLLENALTGDFLHKAILHHTKAPGGMQASELVLQTAGVKSPAYFGSGSAAAVALWYSMRQRPGMRPCKGC